MQKYIFIIIASFSIFSGVALAALEFSERQIEKTALEGGGTVSFVFHFKNDSITPISIADVKADCSCLKAETDKKKYAGGESGTLEAIFQMKGKMGINKNAITVFFNDDPTKTEVLKTVLNITPICKFFPRILLWRKGGEAKVQKSALEFLTPAEFQSVSYSSENLKASVKKTGDKTFTLELAPISTVSEMAATATISFKLSDNSEKSYVVHALVK